MAFFLRDPPDFARHNAEVQAVWAAYHAGTPTRVPVQVHGSIRYYLQNPELNVRGWTFQEFFERLDVQVEAQVAYQKWCRFNLVCDREMGLPEKGWPLIVDFQNSLDSAWAGCPLVYPPGAVPDTTPILDRHKERLYDFPKLLDERAGLLGRALDFYDAMHELAATAQYDGLPIIPPAAAPGEGTDGPLDVAYKLRGADNLIVDMLTDESYYHDLMGWITENLINRMRRMREYRWRKQPDSRDRGEFRRPHYYFADDAIALLSARQYEQYVYPYHRRFFDAFADDTPRTMHLCGDATRHFRFLRDAFNVRTFDTGFPVDHGALRAELGDDVTIQGGPTIMELRYGTPESVRESVRRICSSGVMRGGRFILIAANNMAPMTPLENVAALYDAAKVYGIYPPPA